MRKLLVLPIVTFLFVSFLAVSGFAGEPMGAEIYEACAKCHGADGATSAKAGNTTLKGQAAEALEKKLLGYQEGTYGGAKAVIMKNMVKKLTPEQIKAVASFIAGF